METLIKNRWLKLFAIACCSCELADVGVAQRYTLLHQFTPVTNSSSFFVNSDGLDPDGLVLSGDTLYGITLQGGANGGGTVFAVNTNGTGFTLLYTFSTVSPPCNPCVNSDGFSPSSLLLSGGTLYGVASDAGGNGSGTIFMVNTDGTGFTTLYNFSPVALDSSGLSINGDGARPDSLVLSGNTLYGAARSGGNNAGTIFAVNTDGTGFTTVYSFAAGGFLDTPLFTWTNTDGFGPNSLVLAEGTLYGTTGAGGSSGSGEVFAMNTDGTSFRILHRFTALQTDLLKNNDGGVPVALVLSGENLYGATRYGGSSGAGTVFSINTNGTGFKVLSTGMSPLQLLSAGNALYGIGAINGGFLFSLSSHGSGFTNLQAIPTDNTRAGALIWSGNTLYGCSGGTAGSIGAVFSLSLPIPPPKLLIAPDGSGGYLIDAQGQPNFTCQLERAPGLAGPWTTNAPQTADTNGLIQFHDLSPPFGHAFYRTVQP